MPGTNDVTLRMARSRQRLAEAYRHHQPEPIPPGQDYRSVTLPTFKFYGSKPVSYVDGCLIVGDRVVRRREARP